MTSVDERYCDIHADAYYDLVGTHVHPATHSRDKEVRYVHDLTRRLLPFITPKNTLKCLSLKAFLNDLVAGAVLQPVMDILPDPDIINYILQVSKSNFDFIVWRTSNYSRSLIIFKGQFRRSANKSLSPSERRDG